MSISKEFKNLNPGWDIMKNQNFKASRKIQAIYWSEMYKLGLQ